MPVIKRAVRLLGLGLLLGAVCGLAQTNAETNAPGVQLNFSVPGARSLGLGGSFVGLADDATAAYANPAGLTILREREVFVEYRRWEFDHIFTDGGTARAGNFSGLTSGTASDLAQGVSFASVALPSRGWTVAGFFHQLADFSVNFETEGAVILPQTRVFPARTRGELEIRSVGVAAGVDLVCRKPNEGVTRDPAERDERQPPRCRLSLGLSASHRDFQIDTRTDRFAVDAVESPANYSEGNLHDYQVQSGGEDDWTGTVGLIYRQRRNLQFGGVYRHSSKHRFEAQTVLGPKAFNLTPGPTKTAVYRIPAVLGLGLSWRPRIAHNRVTVNADYYFIEYSDFTANPFVDIFRLEEIDVNPELHRFSVDDAHELHIGIEKLFSGHKQLFFLRGGAWLDPDHGIRFEGGSEKLKGFEAIFREREDEVHLALGAGISSWKYRFDAAVDYSDRFTIYSASIVYRP